MDDEELESYSPRKANDMIDIDRVLIGINSDGISMSWAMLEKTDETPNIFSMNKKPLLYKDILTESEYFIDESGNVTMSRLSPTAVYEDEDVRKMQKFIGAKTIREILEETRKYFDGLELEGYHEEIEKLKELYKKISIIYEKIDNGNMIYIAVRDLELFFNYLINIYTYAFGNPQNKDIRFECNDEKQRSLNEPIDINNICIGQMFYVDAYELKVLERTNKGYSYKDKNGEERRINIYRDILYDTYYYVLDNMEMYTSPIAILKKSKSLSQKEKEYIRKIISLKDAVNLTIERIRPNDKIPINTILGIKRLFELAKRDGKQVAFTVMEIRANDSLLINCYKKAISDKSLIDQDNIIEDVMTISDIISNMAHSLRR